MTASAKCQRKMNRTMNNNGVDCCGYCFEEVEYIVDLRELPCSHIFCLGCLQADFEKHKILECHTCKKNHGDVEVDDLIKVDKLVLSDDNEDDSQPIFCEVCKEDKNPAISFCVDCEKKMCKKHEEYHDEYQNAFSRTQHKKISVEEYKRSPDRFTIRTCHKHDGDELSKVCNKCHKLFCSTCNTEKKCPANKGKMHEVEELCELSRKLKIELSRMMNSLSTKISEVFQQEQKTSTDLHSVENKVTTMNDQVDRLVAEQIEAIKQKAESLKTNIQLFRIDSDTVSTEHISELRKTKSSLGQLWKNTHKLLTQRHDSDIISQYKSTVEEINAAMNQQLTLCPLPLGQMLVKTAEHRDVEVQLREALPFYIDLILKEKKRSGHCTCICTTANKGLLCGRDTVLEILDESTLGSKIKVQSTSVNGVAKLQQGYLALHWENEKNYIIQYSAELAFMKLFGEFFRPTDKYSQLSAYKSQVIAMDPDEKQLNVYNSNGEFQFSTKLTENKRPWGVHAISDGTVLITDFIGGCLRKYRLAKGNQESIWMCPDLVAPVGLDTDAAGLIYVASLSAKRIYILTQHGKKVKELTHPELQKVKEVYDITVNDDMVYLACGSDGVLQFRMMYEALVR